MRGVCVCLCVCVCVCVCSCVWGKVYERGETGVSVRLCVLEGTERMKKRVLILFARRDEMHVQVEKDVEYTNTRMGSGRCALVLSVYISMLLCFHCCWWW